MKMDTMNKIFEMNGFGVERRLENDRYRFFIYKNGLVFSDTFKYNAYKKKAVPFAEEDLDLDLDIKIKPRYYDNYYDRNPMAEEEQLHFINYMINSFNARSKNMYNTTKPFPATYVPYYPRKAAPLSMDIVNVIFNDPATIIIWADGTKTVVKCNGEDYDKEKGFAMAIAKKALGNLGNYYETFKKWLPKNEDAELQFGGKK